MTNDQLSEVPCGILIPAAMGGQIRRGNAPRIEARLVVEGPVPEICLEAVTLRAAAYVLAISRAAAVTLECGIWS